MKSFPLLSSLFFLQALSLSIKVYDTNEYCLRIQGTPNEYLHFTYLVRGRNEDNV